MSAVSSTAPLLRLDITFSYSVVNSDTSLLSATIDGTSVKIIPETNQYGSATITLRATIISNPSLFTDHSFTVNVTPINDPPVINGISIDDIEVTFGESPTVIDITGYSITDIESDAVSSLSVLTNNDLKSPVIRAKSNTVKTLRLNKE